MAKIQDLKEHYKIWKEWKANNKNSKFHQWLVLFKLVRSSTFESVKAWYYFREGLLNSYYSSCTASFENFVDGSSTIISCATCKYEHKDICAEPCMDCDPRRNSPDCKWEAKEEEL